MAATSQMRKSQAKSGWSSIFSSSEQLSEQQSALFVKKLLAVAISSVTYLRAVFPERCFGDRCLEDLNLKILRDEDAFPGSSQVIQWVKGCFDAIDRKFLRKIILGFYLNASDPDTVIETYTFKFDYYCDGINIYRNNQQITSAKTAGDTKTATIRLLRTLVVLTQTLKSLPDDVMMTMKILYFDDVTPSDYEPPGFEATEYLGPMFKDDPYKISVGDVSTPFHVVGLRVQSELQQMQNANEAENDEKEEELDEIGEDDSYLDHESDASTTKKEKNTKQVVSKDTEGDSENPYAIIEQEKPAPMSVRELRLRNKADTEKSVNEDEAMDCSTVSVQAAADFPVSSDSAHVIATQQSQAEEQLVPKADQTIVECSCGYNGDDGMMILCAVCNTWQHASCYLCFTEEECPPLHICVSCAKSENKTCTDNTLTEMNAIALQTTCLWRRALVGCRDLTRLTAPKFAKTLGVELTVAQGLMKRMQNDGFLRQALKGKRLGKLVVKEKLSVEALKKYFSSNKDENQMTASTQRNVSQDATTGNTKKKPLEDEELQRMVNKAAEIDISGNLRTRSAAATTTKELVDEQNKRLRSRKRVVSSIDNELEFSVSDSQDPLDHSEAGTQAKKMKKASAASKAILI